MPYLVDGNNLLGAARDARLGLPRDESALLRLLDRFAQARRSEILVVFDGPAGARRAAGHADRVGRARVRYAGSGRQADDLIVEMIAGWNNPAEITLVSSDNQLRGRAKVAGARVLGCAEFAGRLRDATSGSTSEDDKPLVGDIAEWEEYFRRGR